MRRGQLEDRLGLPSRDLTTGSTPGLEATVEVADDRVIADAQRLADGVIPGCRLGQQQDERPVRFDDPAQPGPERGIGGQGDGPRHVRRGEGGRGAQVDELGAAGQAIADSRHVQRLRCRDAAEHPRAGPVDAAHPGEVARDRGLSGEQRVGEGVGVLDGQQRIGRALDADRARPGLADAARAERAGAMRGQDARLVRLAEERLVQRTVHVEGVRSGVLGAQQVGPADGADEHRSAREDRHRVIARAGAGIADGVADMLRGVTGRLQHGQTEAPDIDGLAVAHRPEGRAQSRRRRR